MYLNEVARRAEAALGPSLDGVYAMGSLALGDWVPARSDVDLAVVGRELDEDALRSLAAAVDHAVLPVPARKLELVAYEAARLRAGRPVFSLNLNTGAGLPTTVELDPARVPGFWFVLDVAIGREHAVAVLGPPLAEFAAAPSRDDVDAALEASLRWHAAHADDAAAALLAAARAYRYARTGCWSPKTTAALWTEAAVRTEDPELAQAVAQAAALRTGRPGRVDPLALERLLERTRAALSGGRTRVRP